MPEQSHDLQGGPLLDRRALLKALAASGVALGLGVRGASAEQLATIQAARAGLANAPRRGPVRPLPLHAVQLLDGPFQRAQALDAAYMLSLDADRMLHNFRKNAGLEPKAPVYGGWESQDPWNEIRCHGHTLGHWLTAGSLMYASTGDRRFRERIDYIVAELQACQQAAGSGLVCAFPDGARQLEAAIRGERFLGVPWYTMHKIFAGLRDAYLHAGNQSAREVLVRLAEWAWSATQGMSEAGFQRMLDPEHGGMNEVLADVHALTGDARFLTLARRFCHRALLDPLAAGRDPLNGLHANTQVPKVIGFLRLYEITGEQEYLAAATCFWNVVVQERSFVTGGHGDQEHFFPPVEFPRRLHSAKTAETCGTHNMLRLTRMLFQLEPSAAHADYYERALYNAILAAQDPETGWNTYFQPMRPGYLKLYHTPIDSFWCCTGSGIENHAKYGDSIYFAGANELYVNLFIASRVHWQEKRLTLTQLTSFPESDVSRLEVTVERPVRATLQVRCPWWTKGASVSVNGRPVRSQPQPGSYVAIEREWRTGDVVAVQLPMHVHTESLPGAPGRIAFLYGPLVLAGRLGREGLYPGADILRNERTTGQILEVPVEVPVLHVSAQRAAAQVRAVAGAAPLTFETVGIGRPRDVTLVPYHLLHHERYNLYWELVDPLG